jgi:hypothetical protein
VHSMPPALAFSVREVSQSHGQKRVASKALISVPHLSTGSLQSLLAY